MSRPTLLRKDEDLDLSAVAEEMVVVAAKVQRAQHQISAAAIAERATKLDLDLQKQQAQLERELAAAKRREEDCSTVLAMVREEMHKWSNEDQSGNRTLRSIADALNIG